MGKQGGELHQKLHFLESAGLKRGCAMENAFACVSDCHTERAQP